MPNRPPTLKDVAARAGVSLKTASRVLNEEGSVRPQTRQVVLQSMEELGFRLNSAARQLRTGLDTSMIGLLIDDLSNPFYGEMAFAIEQGAHDRSMLLITASSRRDVGMERLFVRTLSQRRVCGLVVVPSGSDHAHLAVEQGRGLHVVCLDRPAVGLDADVVLADDEGGARLATSHLLGRGHRDIAYLGDHAELYTNARRLSGYRSAMALGALPRSEELVRTGVSDALAAEKVARDLLRASFPPTAFFAGNNQLTLGVLHALRSEGRRDVAVVGFDDFQAADLIVPGVTVVRHDAAELGRLAAARLFARVDGDTTPFNSTVLPVHLITRGSGEIAP